MGDLSIIESLVHCFDVDTSEKIRVMKSHGYDTVVYITSYKSEFLYLFVGRRE